MSKLSFETILERCVNLLLSGRSISDCQKMYPNVRGLRQALQVAQLAINLPKKKMEFDKNKVWQTIQSKIKEEKAQQVDTETTSNHISPSPLGGFRLAFSRSVFSLVTVMVIIGLVNSTTVAAKNSLPGETLYPVKKTVEKVELVLTIDKEKKTEKKIKHASTRLQETKQILDNSVSENGDKLDEKESKAVEETISALVHKIEEITNESRDNAELLKKLVEILADEQEQIITEVESQTSGDIQMIVKEAKKNLLEKKLSAEETLIELEKKTSENNLELIPTSTEGIIDQKEDSEESTDDETPTSTDEKLEILGSPDTTSTKEIIEPTDNSNESSTPEIINLK